ARGKGQQQPPPFLGAQAPCGRLDFQEIAHGRKATPRTRPGQCANSNANRHGAAAHPLVAWFGKSGSGLTLVTLN
ncbi:MAG: hypothetical protein AABM33_01300, partial [Pseudomonadota bacterium]